MPGLLRAVASADEKSRKDAIYELYGNIWHQGTVYEATIYAVPFLIELLEHPDTRAKSDLACLLAVIADGYGYLEVHARPDSFESDWRTILGKQGKELESEIARVAAVTDRVREAAKIALPSITPYLSDPEPEIRESVIQALSRYPELAEMHLPLLESALDAEDDAEVSAVLEQAIASLRAEYD